MTNFRQLMTALEALYPPQMAESWDQVGNHFGRPDAPVKRLMAVLDLDDASLAEAIEKGVDTLIVHHPVLFSPIRRFDFSSPEQARYEALIKHDIKVFAMHTNFDIAHNGMNDWLAEQLGLEEVTSLTPGAQEGQPGLGRVGNLPQALNRQALLALLKSSYGRTELPVVEAKPKDSYQRIALIGGSGTQPEYIQAAAQSQADVFLTGDISYHRAQLCYQEDMMTVDVGHYVESIFKEKMPAFLTQLAQEQGFDYQVIPSQASTNPFRYE